MAAQETAQKTGLTDDEFFKLREGAKAAKGKAYCELICVKMQVYRAVVLRSPQSIKVHEMLSF